VQGDRRRRIGENVLGIYDLLNRWAESGQRMPLDIQARFLAFAVAGSVLLERVDLIVMSVASYAQCVGSYNSARLPEAAEIAESYMTVVQALASAIDAAAAGPDVFDYYDLPHLKALLDVETPEVLIPETMNVVRLCRSGTPDAQ
jgi:hypothetical protein